MLPEERLFRAYDVVLPGIPDTSLVIVKKEEFLDTCSSYDVAPFTGLHETVGLVERPVDPFEGESNVGAEATDACHEEAYSVQLD